MKKSAASVTVGAATTRHSNPPSAIVILFVIRILVVEDDRQSMRYCWRVGLLAYPPSVLQPELEFKVPRLRSIMVIMLSAMAWVSADVGAGELSRRGAAMGSVLASPPPG